MSMEVARMAASAMAAASSGESAVAVIVKITPSVVPSKVADHRFGRGQVEFRGHPLGN